ncbi:hypothetical protein [Geotalea sp. SG265]|uniref:hypothetical protein n=1 Tax=Geotalea sp. SG265 TaxID=2922867 RepID=UPI001FB00CC8|nr:hypothetical protein [Geotalea sp. SG265]
MTKENETSPFLNDVDLEEVVARLAVLSNALGYIRDGVGLLKHPLDYSQAYGLHSLAGEVYVDLHKAVYGMTPAEKAEADRLIK